ncbi:PREDICTED: golgin subfamily A member 4-like [Nicrophorus vespilloides]|uniref:Kinetochore protein NDC80 n=1 Tax=Nicrophorus vespilloides TaxID=110193 RepID=A0ABM1MD41_NICVS|nr:PREDICTED: golgin subfamily A member 4-like [Nicrophorus vespilloides]
MSERKSRLPVKANRFTLTPTTSRDVSSSRARSVSRGTVSSLSAFMRNKSPNPKKKLPLNDKEWQKSTLTKIRRYLHGLDPEIKLTPLSTPMFIYATNLLLRSRIDPNIELTKENYQTELPIILNIVEYPTTFSAATLKHPNMPHSLPAILAMWLFLLDLESDNDVKPVFDNCPQAKVYLDFCINSLTDPDLQIESVNDELNQIYGINEDQISITMNEVQRLKKENEVKQLNNEELYEMRMSMEDEECKMREKLTELESVTSCYDEVFQSLKHTENDLDEDLKKLNEINSELKDKLEANGLNDLSDLRTKIAEDLNTLGLLQEKRDYNMNKITKLDKDNIEIKREVESSIFKSNNYILDLGLEPEEVNELMAPTTGFGRPDIVDDFKNILGKWTKLMQHSETERIEIAKLDVENNQMELKFAMRQSYLRLLDDKESKIQEKSKLKFEVMQEKILAAVNEYEGIQKSMEEISLYKDNVQKVKLKYKELVKKNELRVKECQENYNEYSEMILDNIKEMSEVVKSYTKRIQGDNDKALKEFQVLTEYYRTQNVVVNTKN